MAIFLTLKLILLTLLNTFIMKKLSYFLAAIFCLFLASCGKKEVSPEFIPVLEDKEGMWGLVAPNGEMLFSEEFEHKPTSVFKGRFFAKNADGFYEMYTAEAKPEKVGAEYKQAGVFFEDVAPVVEKGKPVEFIDVDGNVKFALKDVDGVPVECVYNFQDGVAIFRTEDGLCGLINPKGDVLLKGYAQLESAGDGKIWATESKYLNVDEDSAKVCLIDYKGKKFFEIAANKYEWRRAFKDGLCVVTQKDSEYRTRMGIINDKDEWVVKPSNKLHEINDVMGDKFIYYDGDNFGLMNLEGEVLLRAKYDRLSFATEDLLIAGNRKDNEMYFMDLEGNKVGNHGYEAISKIPGADYAWALEGKNSWIIIDLKGEPVNKQQSFYENATMYSSVGDYTIESDYTDIPLFVKGLNLTADGMKGINLNAGKDEILKYLEIESYQYRRYADEIQLKKSFYSQKVPYTMNIGLRNELIGKKKSGWFSYDYFAMDTSVDYLHITFDNAGRLEGKMKELFEAIKAEAAAAGAKEDENSESCMRYTLGKNRLLVLYSDIEVTLVLENENSSCIDEFLGNFDCEIEDDI